MRTQCPHFQVYVRDIHTPSATVGVDSPKRLPPGKQIDRCTGTEPLEWTNTSADLLGLQATLCYTEDGLLPTTHNTYGGALLTFCTAEIAEAIRREAANFVLSLNSICHVMSGKAARDYIYVVSKVWKTLATVRCI